MSSGGWSLTGESASTYRGVLGALELSSIGFKQIVLKSPREPALQASLKPSKNGGFGYLLKRGKTY